MGLRAVLCRAGTRKLRREHLPNAGPTGRHINSDKAYRPPSLLYYSNLSAIIHALCRTTTSPTCTNPTGHGIRLWRRPTQRCNPTLIAHKWHEGGMLCVGGTWAVHSVLLACVRHITLSQALQSQPPPALLADGGLHPKAHVSTQPLFSLTSCSVT